MQTVVGVAIVAGLIYLSNALPPGVVTEYPLTVAMMHGGGKFNETFVIPLLLVSPSVRFTAYRPAEACLKKEKPLGGIFNVGADNCSLSVMWTKNKFIVSSDDSYDTQLSTHLTLNEPDKYGYVHVKSPNSVKAINLVKYCSPMLRKYDETQYIMNFIVTAYPTMSTCSEVLIRFDENIRLYVPEEVQTTMTTAVEVEKSLAPEIQDATQEELGVPPLLIVLVVILASTCVVMLLAGTYHCFCRKKKSLKNLSKASTIVMSDE